MGVGRRDGTPQELRDVGGIDDIRRRGVAGARRVGPARRAVGRDLPPVRIGADRRHGGPGARAAGERLADLYGARYRRYHAVGGQAERDGRRRRRRGWAGGRANRCRDGVHAQLRYQRAGRRTAGSGIGERDGVRRAGAGDGRCHPRRGRCRCTARAGLREIGRREACDRLREDQAVRRRGARHRRRIGDRERRDGRHGCERVGRNHRGECDNSREGACAQASAAQRRAGSAVRGTTGDGKASHTYRNTTTTRQKTGLHRQFRLY